MKQFRTLLAFLLLMFAGNAWGQITETFSSWTSRTTYGTYTQAGSGGTWNMTQCIVSPGAAANGVGSAGLVQLNSSTGVLTLPNIASGGVGTLTFVVRMSSTTSAQLNVEKNVNGGGWTNIGTYTTTLSTTGTSYPISVNDASANIQIRFTTASSTRAAFIHDVTTTTAATNFYWNGPTSTGTGASTGGTGTWNTSTTNWRSPTDVAGSASTAWTNSTSNIANFTAGSGTVTMGTSITAGNTIISTTGYTFAPNATISLTSPVKLDQTLTVAPTGGNSFTMGGIVSSSGGLTQNGAGTTILSAANTYSGATTINLGTLQLGANSTLPSATDVTLANTAGAILDVNGKTQTINSLAGGGGTGGNITLGAGTLTISGTSPSTTYSGIISGTSGALIKSGTSTLTLGGANTYTGATTINGGVLSISSIANGGSASNIGQSTNVAANLVLGGGTLQYTGSSASTDRNFTLTAATTSTINVTNALTISGASTSTTGALTKTGAGTLTLAGANTYTGSTTVSAGTLYVSGSTASGSAVSVANGATLAGAGTVAGTVSLTGSVAPGNDATATANLATGAFTFNANSIYNVGISSVTGTAGNASGWDKITSTGTVNVTATPIVINLKEIGSSGFSNTTPYTWAIISGNSITGFNTANFTLNVVSGFSGYTGTFSVTQTGGNTINVVYTPAPTNYFWNGPTTAGSGPATGGSGTWNTSTTNWISPTNDASGASAAWTNGSTNVANFANGSGTVTMGTSITAGNTIITASGYTFAPNATISLASPVKLDQSLTVAPTNGNTFTMSGILSSTGALTQNDAGATTLSGVNTHTGGVTLTTGTLNINNAAALGGSSGTFTINGGTVDNTSGSAITNSNNNPQTWGADFTFTGTNNLNLGTGAVAITASATRTVTVGGGTLTVGGAISGASSNLTKAGAGILSLSGANTYSGGSTTINAGTLQLGANGTLPSSTAVTLANTAGAVLDVNGKTQTIGSLSGGGATGGNVTLGAGTLTVSGTSPTSTTYSGIISGTGALVKSGTSALTLAGANTYTGSTTVSAGTLYVSGSTASGSAVSVANGATLAGAGTVAGTVSLTGSVAPGNDATATANLATGAFTFNANSIYNVGISSVTGTAGNASGWDKITSTGTVNVTATPIVINLKEIGSSGFSDGSPYTWAIISGSAITGFNAANITLNVVSGFSGYTGTFSITQTGGTTINVVYTPLKPEPSNYPTGFQCGTTDITSIPLQWTDATGTTLPDGYLIKWSSTSYAAVTAPVDGTAEADATSVKNIAQSAGGTYTVTGLTASTTYYFKIWSYTNAGTKINYKLASEPQTSCTTQDPPPCSPLWEENFDYGCVDNADILSIPEASTNWTIRTVTPKNNFNYDAGGNLSYSGYTPTGGGAGRFIRGSNRDNIKRLINADGSTVTSGIVYTSFLVNFNNNSGNGDDYFFTFKDQNDNLRGHIHVDNSTSSGTGSKFRFGVSKAGSSTSDYQTGEYNFNTTYLCVVKYKIISGSNNDSVSLWVFSSGMPTSETAAGTATIASASGSDWGTGNNEMKYILLRQTSGGADGFIDGIRLGTTWEDVACSATPSAKSYTWTGNTSSVWTNANNWSPNTGYPTAIDDITISTSTPNKLNITDCRTVKNFTLNSTGNFDMSVDGTLTITGTTAYDGTNGAGTSSNLACATQVQEDAGIEGSHVYITSSASQIVPPLNYANLDIQGGNRTFLSGKTIGICARFNVDPTLYSYTVTGSTVEYKSALLNWVLTPFTYYNLKFSGSGDFSIGYSSSSANKTMNVLNDFTQTAGTVFLGENSTATATLNIDGNMTMTGGLFDMNNILGGKGTLNLKGDLSIATGATINANSTTVANTNFNFTGTYDALQPATIQTINVASTGTTRNRYVAFNIKSGAYAQLSTSNFELGIGGAVNAEAGSILDFGFNGSTALYITNVLGATSTSFTTTGNAKLIITHPNGIDGWSSTPERAIDGNVQIVGSRTYSSTGIYHYKGKASQQRLGDGILAGGISGKYVIVELDALSTKLLLEGNSGTSTSVFSELTDIGLSNTGNGLKIIQGTVVGTATSDFMSTGNLEMTGGLYQIAFPYGSSNVVPRLSGTYTLTGGTIELNGSAAQILRGGNLPNTPIYYNLKMSGANTVKINNTPIKVANKLEISNSSTTFDVENNSMTGDAGITMSAGLLRLSAKTTLPELDGIATAYSLTGGTVELYGTSNSQTQSLRGNYGTGSPKPKITYYNVELNATGANVAAGAANVVAAEGFNIGSGGVMNVNSPACFQLASTYTIGGAGTFNITAGSTFKYGGTIASTGATGNVQTTTRNFLNTASYGFVGNTSPQDPGSGLPNKMVNMYLDKTTAGNLVTITQDEEVTNTLNFYTGIVKTNANTLYVSNTSTSAITSGNTSGTDKYVQGRLKWKTNLNSEYIFPIGESTKNAQGFKIKPITGSDGSDVLGYLETNNTTPVQAKAFCDLEDYPGGTTGTVPVGSGNAGYDGRLDLVTFNLRSPLQWDVTNTAGSITKYDITVLANGAQDISPIKSKNNLEVRYLLKNGIAYDGSSVATVGPASPTSGNGYLACPNGYSLSGMTSFSKFTLDGADAGSTSLPVKLISLTATPVNNSFIRIDWATALEINNAGFEVQRSVDGKNFSKIGWVDGNGNATQQIEYSLNDYDVQAGITYYYRLKQIDFDGQFEISKLVSAKLSSDNTVDVKVYPIPAKDKLNISINAADITIAKVKLFNVIGAEVASLELNLAKGLNTHSLETSNLAAGNYVVSIVTANDVFSQKIVIEK